MSISHGLKSRVLTLRSHFSGWKTDAEVGTPEYYSRQSYTLGTKCWNGPQRSVQVRRLTPSISVHPLARLHVRLRKTTRRGVACRTEVAPHARIQALITTILLFCGSNSSSGRAARTTRSCPCRSLRNASISSQGRRRRCVSLWTALRARRTSFNSRSVHHTHCLIGMTKFNSIYWKARYLSLKEEKD